jgi:hypothetical protein
MNAVERIAERINAGERPGCMSCGEQIAAALIFNRPEWLPLAYKHPLDAIDRLGENWFQMVMEYHKSH